VRWRFENRAYRAMAAGLPPAIWVAAAMAPAFFANWLI
jgi:hypothetical protein